jgi:hypothetical protein
MPNHQVYLWLWQDLAIFLLIGALAGIVLALLLIIKPQLLERINRQANRWISTRSLNQLMDRSISIEHWFYQHHRASGAFAVAGAIYLFVYFSLLFDKAAALHHWRGVIHTHLLEGLLDALVLSAFTGAAFALIAGLFLWLRPSLLRGMEMQANQWVSSRRATKVLDVPHYHVDQFVARHARRVGWLLLLASIGLFFMLFRLML